MIFATSATLTATAEASVTVVDVGDALKNIMSSVGIIPEVNEHTTL